MRELNIKIELTRELELHEIHAIRLFLMGFTEKHEEIKITEVLTIGK